MANINSISSNSYSSTSSIYGSRNVLSGLASGLDTETMIENSVSGYKTKITQLQQEQEKLTWKQDAYRDITDKLINLNQTYTSYTSKTNLYSESFFTAATTSTNGVNASKISASGKATSNVAINSVSRLASAAKYTVSADALGLAGMNAAGKGINLAEMDENSAMTVTVDGVTKSYKLKDLGLNKDDTNLNSMVENLNAKAAEDFGAGKVAFEANSDGGLSIKSVTGNSTVQVGSNLKGLGLGESGLTNYLDTTKSIRELMGNRGTWEEVRDSGGKVTGYKGTLNINGVDIDVNGNDPLQSVIEAINRSGAGVTASFSKLTGEFSFTSKETGAGSKIDFGAGLASELFKTDNSPSAMKVGDMFSNIQWGEDGNAKLGLSIVSMPTMPAETFTINKNDTMEDLIGKIEGISDGRYAGMIQYDSDTGTYGLYNRLGNPLNGSNFALGQYVYNPNPPVYSDELLEGTLVTLGDLAEKANTLSTFTAGEDAEMNVTVNGKDMTLTRSNNSFDIDGMSVTVKETFSDGAVTFDSKTDSSSILEGIRSFVNDYNDVVKAIHDAYTTQPAEKNSTSHARYDPLTEDDKADMSENAIAKYEEKAKQGILFGDSDLSMLYNRLNDMVSSGSIGQKLREIGIDSVYDGSSRLTTLEIDEEKLRTALDSDPEKVSEVFASAEKDSNGNSLGLIAGMKETLNQYASTSSASPGILVNKAGTKLSSVSLLKNQMQEQIDNVEEKITNWQTKMSSKIDYYTRQFTALEKLMNTMNSQSSMLSGLMGY